MAFLAFVGSITFIIGLLCMFNGHPAGGFETMIAGGAMHVPPYFARQRRREKAAAFLAEFRAQAGFAEGGVFEHAHGATAIAVNPARRTMTLASGEKMKTYPLSDVREWSTNLATAAQTVMLGGGLASAVAVGGANMAAGARAAAATGLFVSVRDIENAKWRIEMTSEADQAKWMEILEQTINERRAEG